MEGVKEQLFASGESGGNSEGDANCIPEENTTDMGQRTDGKIEQISP